MPWITPASGASVDTIFPASFIKHWRRLALETNQGDPVCCAPAWNLTFHEIFSPERRIYYLASEQTALIFADYPNSYGAPVMVPLEDSWMFGQPLLGLASPVLLRAACDELHREFGKPPIFMISGIQESLPASRFLYAMAPKGYSFFRHSAQIQASASLAGGLDGWASRRSANHRAKLRKAKRKAKEAGVYFQRFCPDNGNVGKIYQRMLSIEEKSWKGIGHCGMSESPSRQYYASLISRLAKTHSSLVIFAKQEERDLGFIFGSLAGPYYRGQQFSYTQEAAKLSIGNLMQLEKIRWLCELGFQRYDMGPVTGERMGYKTHWTEQFREIQTWVMRK